MRTTISTTGTKTIACGINKLRTIVAVAVERGNHGLRATNLWRLADLRFSWLAERATAAFGATLVCRGEPVVTGSRQAACSMAPSYGRLAWRWGGHWCQGSQSTF